MADTHPASVSQSDNMRELLPFFFAEAEVEDLVVLIADMLTKLIKHNDTIQLSKEHLTRFHSRAPPSISVLEYLRRIVKFTYIEKAPLIVMLHYIDIFALSNPTFTLSSLTVHRFLIAATCIAAKAYSDSFCTNHHYAKVGGIKVTELNMLERELLKGLAWQLVCPPSLLQRYYSSLVVSHGGYAQAAQRTTQQLASPPSSSQSPPKVKDWFNLPSLPTSHVLASGPLFVTSSPLSPSFKSHSLSPPIPTDQKPFSPSRLQLSKGPAPVLSSISTSVSSSSANGSPILANIANIHALLYGLSVSPSKRRSSKNMHAARRDRRIEGEASPKLSLSPRLAFSN